MLGKGTGKHQRNGVLGIVVSSQHACFLATDLLLLSGALAVRDHDSNELLKSDI